MTLMFRQRFFSWFDSYDIFDENGETVFTVEGKLSWGKCLHVLDRTGNHIATLKQVPFSFFPTFEIYIEDELRGSVSKRFSLFRPVFEVDYRNWTVDGNYFEWDYEIFDECENRVAIVSKQLFHMTDTYSMELQDPSDALDVLMLVLAIDAEKDNRN